MKARHAITLLPLLAAFAVRDIHAAETIRSTDGIRSINIRDAVSPGVPFDIKAWVVYPERIDCDEYGIYIIKDDSGSATLQNRLAATNATICAGDHVRATGRVVLDGNGICIYAYCHEMTRLAHKTPEPPVRMTV